jgi:hypothetical protein
MRCCPTHWLETTTFPAAQNSSARAAIAAGASDIRTINFHNTSRGIVKPGIRLAIVDFPVLEGISRAASTFPENGTLLDLSLIYLSPWMDGTLKNTTACTRYSNTIATASHIPHRKVSL